MATYGGQFTLTLIVTVLKFMSEDVLLSKVNQRYKDDHGALVTVTSVEETHAGWLSSLPSYITGADNILP